MATIEEFQKIDVRVGRIVEVSDFPEAKKSAYKLTIDFGPLGIKNSSAQITEVYNNKEDLRGRLVVAVINFPIKRVAGFPSEVLVLGVPDENGRVVLLQPERDVPLGGRIY